MATTEGRVKPAQDVARRATMEDVAARAGVSRALVSLVMRKAPNVSDERRARVLAAAAELGYRPNAMARSLASHRTRTIGVVINDLHNPFFAEIAEGIERAAQVAGYRVLLSAGSRHRLREEAALEAFLEYRVDGVVLLSTLLRRRTIGEAAALVPLVVESRTMASSPVDTIVNDDIYGEQLAVGHLIDLGHRRIAHVTGGDDPSARPRRTGYERAMAAAGIEPLVTRGDFSENGGAEAARVLASLPDPPTAIVAANDLAAAGAMSVLAESGFAIPRDISVVGYDNTFLAGLRQISLTTVDQPREEMGRLAFATLLERIEGGRMRAVHHVTTPTLVVRGSSGPPPGRRSGASPRRSR